MYVPSYMVLGLGTFSCFQETVSRFLVVVGRFLDHFVSRYMSLRAYPLCACRFLDFLGFVEMCPCCESRRQPSRPVFIWIILFGQALYFVACLSTCACRFLDFGFVVNHGNNHRDPFLFDFSIARHFSLRLLKTASYKVFLLLLIIVL